MGFDKAMFIKQTVDENLICGICHDVLEKPMTACQNGHTFCQLCLKKSMDTSTKCPTCRSTLSIFPTFNRPLQNMLLSMKVRCLRTTTTSSPAGNGGNSNTSMLSACRGNTDNKENNDEIFCSAAKKSRREFKVRPNTEENTTKSTTIIAVCGWEGKLSDYIEIHNVRTCRFLLVRCPLGCGKKIKNKDVEGHKVVCCNRQVICRECNASMGARLMKRHKQSSCPESILSCDFCHEKMARKLLGNSQIPFRQMIPQTRKVDDLPYNVGQVQAYRGNEFDGHFKICPKMKIKCDFAKFGCKEEVTRENLDDHNAKFARTHALLVADGFKSLEKKIADLEAKVEKLDKDGRFEEGCMKWIITERDLFMERFVPNFTVVSGAIPVAGREVYLRLRAAIDGHVTVKVCVWSPRFLPVIIDKISICLAANRDFGTASFDHSEETAMSSFPTNTQANEYSVGGHMTILDPNGTDDDPCEYLHISDIIDLAQRNDPVELTAKFRIKKMSSGMEVGSFLCGSVIPPPQPLNQTPLLPSVLHTIHHSSI